jgi:hypothetical protein
MSQPRGQRVLPRPVKPNPSMKAKAGRFGTQPTGSRYRDVVFRQISRRSLHASFAQRDSMAFLMCAIITV